MNSLRYSCVVLLLLTGPLQASDFEHEFTSMVRPFLQQNCYHCHDQDRAKAGFRVDNLTADFFSGSNAEHWKEAMDRMNLGEMPPEDEIQPEIEKLAAVVDWINRGLREAELRAANAGGAIPMRRMNRNEFANTIRDLFLLDPKKVAVLTETLPADGKAEGFDRLGVALFFDENQLEQTMSVASAIAETVVVDPEMDHPDQQKRHHTEQIEESVRLRPRDNDKIRDTDNRVPFGAKDYFVKENGVEFLVTYVTHRRGAGWGQVAQVRLSDTVTEDGYYRIRIFGKGKQGNREEPNRLRLTYCGDSPYEKVTEVEVDPSGVTEVTLFLRSGPKEFSRGMKVEWNQTPKVILKHPRLQELYGQRRKAIRAISEAKKSGAANLQKLEKELAKINTARETFDGPHWVYNPELDIENLPRLFLDRIEVEGPVVEEWPPPGHKRLFFADNNQALTPEYAEEVIRRFLPFAYRRPVAEGEVEIVTDVAHRALDEGKGFYPAMRLALTRVLSSPNFLFLGEPTRPNQDLRALTPFEIANRLSYFLWNSMPDQQLLALAANGQLARPGIIELQVARMLKDPKADAFIENFAGQWLDVREYGNVEPANQYRDYDEALLASSKEEPYAFFREILSNDLPILNFLQSDFVMVDERLARHYKIEGVEGEEFRRVALQPDDQRGGVLGMAGLMTLLSDGTRTLPIRRATWVKTKLFDDPPGNPPPNAGEIQPNTSGENLTVRERLEKHRNEPTCASCHLGLDPYGIGLENYDAVGAWRERANGENFRGHNTPELDVSGEFPNGVTFNDLQEYKAGLLAQKDQFARAFAKQMLIFALGRPVGFTDETTLEQLTDRLKENDYRLHSLITGIALSRPFLTK